MTALTLDDVRILDDHNFPHHLLAGCHTALVVFCAAFLGRQDAVWVADAGLQATCVDADQEKLDQMWALYPDGWEFCCDDAYQYAEQTDRQWDIVTLDPFTQHMARCADNIAAWCRVARHAVIMGTGLETLVRPPNGWRVTERRRRTSHDGGVFWTILEPS